VFWFPLISLLLVGSACNAISSDVSGFLTPELPDHFPPFSNNHQLTKERVELGRWLFYDTRLSRDGTRSCGICHEQSKAFSDGLIRGLGIENTPLPLNSLALFNIAWREDLTWYQSFEDISSHMEIPLFATDPVEMGMDEVLLQHRLEESERYAHMFAAAFPDDEIPITTANTVQAIADFTVTIVSGHSPYDQWLLGENTLSEEELEGMNLFFGDKMRCSACHGGLFFDEPDVEQTELHARHGYFNTGLYNIEGGGSYPENSQGLILVTGKAEDMGKFRIPSLRNLSFTYPWMHDGTELSLENILSAYAQGGRVIESGPHQGDGRQNPYKSHLIAGFEMTDSEKSAVLSFLGTLNDEQLLEDEKWQTPFCMEEAGQVINPPCTAPFLLE